MLEFTVAPDFPPDKIAAWYVFNTFLQRNLGEEMHLELHDTFDAQRAAIAADAVDLIYASPFDAAELVRNHGFVPIARPLGSRDEVTIAVAESSPIDVVDDLPEGSRVALTSDPVVELIGMIILEVADLDADSVELLPQDAPVLVAKALIQGEADVGFFLADAYQNLSKTTKARMKILVDSEISVITHALMAGPRLAERVGELQDLIAGMGDTPAGEMLLADLGLTGWSKMELEDAEFMIDLMDTLSAS